MKYRGEGGRRSSDSSLKPGEAIKVKRGIYKGYKGTVVAVNGLEIRIELHSKKKLLVMNAADLVRLSAQVSTASASDEMNPFRQGRLVECSTFSFVFFYFLFLFFFKKNLGFLFSFFSPSFLFSVFSFLSPSPNIIVTAVGLTDSLQLDPFSVSNVSNVFLSLSDIEADWFSLSGGISTIQLRCTSQCFAGGSPCYSSISSFARRFW